jgi:glycolate oxidase iron-sulfur subunit
MGLEEEASQMARRNVDHFNKVRAEAIISLCPTCTMVIKEQYPQLTGDTISNIMDINEFMLQSELLKDLAVSPQVVTYHDPCHLSFGLGIKKQPREILNNIEGLELKEMKHADECCGFAGLFSLHYKDMSKTLSTKKMENIHNTSAETVVTSCPGCIMQLEAMQQKSRKKVRIRHIVEVIDEAMHMEEE